MFSSGISEHIWTYLNISEHIWTYLNLSKHIRISLYISEHLWTNLNILEHLWVILKLSKYIWTNMNIFEHLRTYLNICALIRTFVVTGTIFKAAIMLAWKTIQIDECLHSLDLRNIFSRFRFHETFQDKFWCLEDVWSLGDTGKYLVGQKDKSLRIKKEITKFSITFIGLIEYLLIQIFLSTKSWNTSSSLSLSSSKHHDKSKFLYCFLLSQ